MTYKRTVQSSKQIEKKKNNYTTKVSQKSPLSEEMSSTVILHSNCQLSTVNCQLNNYGKKSCIQTILLHINCNNLYTGRYNSGRSFLRLRISRQIHWLCLYRPCIAGIIADKSYLTYLLDHTAPYMVTYPPYRHPWQLGIPEPDYSVLFSEYS